MKKIPALLVLVVLCLGAFPLKAQDAKEEKDPERLNNYKYIIIPMKFNFQEEENEYLLNSRVKHLLNQENFKTVMEEGDLPEDLLFDRCLALNADLESKSEGFFTMQTELQLVFKNCHNKVVYKTKLGTSRAKDFKKGYIEALDDAFTSFSDVNYEYNGKKGPKGDEAIAQEDEKPEVSNPSGNPLSSLQGKTFTRDGVAYEVSRIKAGYLLVNSQTGDREALMNLTEDGTVLFNGKEVNGTASIKNNGSIIQVEFFDRDEGELRKVIYKVE